MHQEDEDVHRRIRNFLHQRRVSALKRVKIDVCKGTVVISGRVSSFYEKQLCISCCQHVAGVIKLVDEVDVVENEALPSQSRN